MLLSKSSLFNLLNAAIMEKLQVTHDMCFSLMISSFLTVQELGCINDSYYIFLFLLLLLLLSLILLFFLFHLFLLILLLIIIMEGDAKASRRWKVLGVSAKSCLLVPLLHPPFSCNSILRWSIPYFFALPIVILGQIKLPKHQQKYSTLYVENSDI